MNTFVRLSAPLLVLLCCFESVSAATIDFESLSDSESVTSQIPGLSFSNAIALKAGLSLNELEFPPASGSTVISDFNGAVIVEFSAPIREFSAHFTYSTPLTISAFDTSLLQIGAVSSDFSTNLALSGDPGSLPNEVLAINSSTGIHRVTIAGDVSGSSFAMDDLAFSPINNVPIPLPGSFALCALGLVLASKFMASAKRVRPRRTELRLTRYLSKRAALCAVLLGLGLPGYAVNVSPPSTSPASLQVLAVTPITFSARIHRDPAEAPILPGGVNLIKVDLSGKGVVLGAMRDDGQGADQQAGDGVFVLSTTLTETTLGPLDFYVSVAQRGVLRRTQSTAQRILVYRPLQARKTTVLPAGDTLSLTNGVTLVVPPQTFSRSDVELSLVDLPAIDLLASDLASETRVLANGPRIAIRSTERPARPVTVRIPVAANLAQLLSQGKDVKVLALTHEVGAAGENDFSLVAIGGIVCPDNLAVCVTVSPDGFFQENPFVVYLTVAVYQPDATGRVQLWDVIGAQPAPANITVPSTGTLTFSATINMLSPFGGRRPSAGTSGPLSHFGPRCVNPLNNNIPEQLPPCPPGLLIRQHNGLDFQPGNQPVSSVINGTVSESAYRQTSAGYRVWINGSPPDSNNFNVGTGFLHLSCNGAVAAGAQVQASAIVGISSGTGSNGCNVLTYAPHLHFATTLNGVLIDPEPLLDGDVNQFLPFQLQLILRVGTAPAQRLADIPQPASQAVFSHNVSAADLAPCLSNSCTIDLVAVLSAASVNATRPSVHLLRRWTVISQVVTILNPFGDQTSSGPYRVEVLNPALTLTPAPSDIEITLLREVVSQCRGLLFSSNRLVTVSQGQSSGSYDFNAARDPFCNSLPITTRYTLTAASLVRNNVRTPIDLTAVPPARLVLSIMR